MPNEEQNAQIEGFRESYREMLGFFPPRVAARFEQLEEHAPEVLIAHEAWRAALIYPDALDQKTVQLMVLAILASKLSDAAKLHGLAARRVGATDDELRAAINLASLFSGISVANRLPVIMADIDELEASL